MAARLGKGWLSRCGAVLALALTLLMPPPAGEAQDSAVDLALVLAVDCSFSVDAVEFRLQMEGLGRAFLRPEVRKAIQAGHRQRIAVIVMQWSDEGNQMVVLPWTIVAGDADADEVGHILARMPRRLAEGGTSISAALIYGQALFATAPPAERRVIDVSTDGRNNIGAPVDAARDRVVASGITINGLTILNEWPTLDIYFEEQVAGGEGHFVMPANNYDAYGDAIYRKLLKEITGPGIS
ncbi:MAG: DUF1194 domain-containing protein [Rhizobiales bacterium]|nr:DUF1194 domain-containing protein [Hyphomicrobiales bacterium]